MQFAFKGYLADSCWNIKASLWESQNHHFCDIRTQAPKDQLPVCV